jgi:hypothetical protein
MARNNQGAQGTPLSLRHNLAGIKDIYIREAFQEIHDFLHSHDILRGVFRKVEFEAPGAGTHVVEHCLPFVPCEVWITNTGGVTVGIDFNTLNETSFEITTSGEGSVKFLAGNIANVDTR